MWNEMRATWALLVGMGFMMLGNGLQLTLLGVRATMEDFSTITTGIMMSAYSIGILVGSLYAPKLVGRVGHIRVFAALASIASIAVLVHAVYVNPLTWTLMRFLTGVSFAGLYVVTESWLNDRAGNENRGKLLSVYMVICTLGLGSGQFLMNLADPLGAELFIIASVVISFGLIPMLLTARPAPAFEFSTKMTLKRLFKASPLAVISNGLTGVVHGAIFGLGAAYASGIGFDVKTVSIFMACLVYGGLLFQWPMGYLSDRIERRIVIAGIGLVVAILAVAVTMTEPGSGAFFVVTFFIGGSAMPLYAICIAHANDRLEPEEIVAASGSLVMVVGVGLSAGPVLGSVLMANFGHTAFFYTIAAGGLAIFGYASLRMLWRRGVEVEDQSPALATGQIGTLIAEITAPDAVDYVEAVASGEVERLETQEEDADKVL